MPRPKGIPKTGGRARGTPNRSTRQLQDVIETALGKTVPEAIVDRLGKVSANDQLRVLSDLMGYIYPRRKAVEYSEQDETQSDGEDVRKMSDEELDRRVNELARKALDLPPIGE